MRLHHKAVSLSLPYVEVYLWRAKGSRRFDFDNGVAEWVLCGGAGVFFLSIRVPPMLLRAPLARRCDAPSLTPGLSPRHPLPLIYKKTTEEMGLTTPQQICIHDCIKNYREIFSGDFDFMPSLTSARVLQELESAILSGQFKPRERLIEMDLIGRFGVSRTVVREAFNKLEAKGLIRSTPYRGVVVADLTVKEIEEIYFVRVAVEKMAVRLVVENIRAEEILALRKMNQEVEDHLRRKTPQMIEKDWEFHRAIFRACPNRYLFEIIDYLRTKAYLVAYHAWSFPPRIEQSILEHWQMIRAIEKRDRACLERLIVKHLKFSKNSYLAQLKGGDFEEPSRTVRRASKSKTQSASPARRKHSWRRWVAENSHL